MPRQSFTRQLFFRDIKMTIEVLRRQMPEMIRKEVLMQLMSLRNGRLVAVP